MASRRHVVRAGECMTSIAVAHGYVDHTKVYEHPDNAELKERRPNPNVLAPGDVVKVPEPELRQESAPVDEAHRFVRKRAKKELRIALLDRRGEPMANQPYTLEVAGAEPREGQTDGEGRLKEAVPLGARAATLSIGERTLSLTLGGLGPASSTPDDGIKGIQARLHNLGYNVGSEDGVIGPRTRAAIAMFQHEHGLGIDGQPSDELRGALLDEHGS